MRDQYAGDVSDLLKFAFLRTLGADDKSIGVGWYYNPRHDGRPDGRHREYCDEPNWASFDLDLWNALRRLPEQSVAALEKLPIWPTKTRFHRIPVPPAGSRGAWANNMVIALQEASIVFLDPDNGLGAASERHATVAEIAALRKPGRTVVLIKFPGWGKKHAEQIEEYHRSLRSGAGALSAVTVRTNVFVNSGELTPGVPRARWFTLVDADNRLIERAEQFAARLNAIDRCSARVVHDLEPIAMSPEKPRDAVLRLMGLLERGLRALTPDQSTPFHKQVEAHRGKFSDIAGVTEARRVRNALAHGEDVSDTRSEEAQAILKQALTEVLLHCPERLQTAMREATRSAPGVVTSDGRSSDARVPVSTQSRAQPSLPRNVKPNQDREANAALPVCDWVYFAAPAKAGRDNTRAVVSEFGMIVRPVYENSESRGKPKPIPNVKGIQQGQTILLVYGGKGEPYRAMFACKVVAPARPVPGFEKTFSFADVSQAERLTTFGFTRDSHFNEFTGISVEVSPASGSIQTPPRGNTIRKWEQVFGGTMHAKNDTRDSQT